MTRKPDKGAKKFFHFFSKNDSTDTCMPKITGKIKVQLLFFPLHNYRQQATQHDHNMWTWKKKKQEKQSTSFKTEIENDI